MDWNAFKALADEKEKKERRKAMNEQEQKVKKAPPWGFVKKLVMLTGLNWAIDTLKRGGELPEEVNETLDRLKQAQSRTLLKRPKMPAETPLDPALDNVRV